MPTPTPDTGFNAALQRINRANDELLEGRAELLKRCFSHRDDVSLFGGFGGHEVGWRAIEPRLDWVAASFGGGRCAYETLSTVVGTDLACVVQFERGEVRLTDGDPPHPIALRVTMVLRWEDGDWKLIHRHGDPLIEKRKEIDPSLRLPPSAFRL